MRFSRFVAVLIAAAATVAPAAAKSQAAPSAPAPAVIPVVNTRPPAAPADVASIDAIIAALYDVISGPVGQTRNWNRMRSGFLGG